MIKILNMHNEYALSRRVINIIGILKKTMREDVTDGESKKKVQKWLRKELGADQIEKIQA